MPLRMPRSPSFPPHRQPQDHHHHHRLASTTRESSWVWFSQSWSSPSSRSSTTTSSSSPSTRMPLLARPSLLLHISVVILLVLGSALLNNGRSSAWATAGLSAFEQQLARKLGQSQNEQTPLDASSASSTCVSQDRANVLAETFPNNATGVLNATLAIIPISLEAARRIIPPQYGILEKAYRALLPDFPEGMYPVLLQAAHDHDVQLRAFGIRLDDFSRVGFEFPFLDFLGDGHSSFRWAPAQLISASHAIALEGSRAYGTVVSPAEWDPVCDAYHRTQPDRGDDSPVRFSGRSAQTGEFVDVEMMRVAWKGKKAGEFHPYPVSLFRNITNQPTFANGSTCDNMIRLFNTSLSTGGFAPRAVRGTVRARAFPFLKEEGQQGEGEGEQSWADVYGVQVATPFIENNYLDCRSMKGYEGSGGPGDSYIQGSNINDDL